MTFQKSVVTEKLNRIDGYLGEIAPSLKMSSQEILSNIEKMRFLERNFQLIVDEMIDVNQHFIKELGLDISNDLEGTFHILGENNILPQDFALKIAPAVGLRNRLVHRYEELKPKLFVESFQKDYSDFKQYMEFIISYLESKNE